VTINATLVAQMIVFLILIWITMKNIWPHLMTAMDQRAQRIAEGHSSAEKARKDLADADARVADEIRKARVEATAIIDKAHQQANQIIDKAKQDAVVEAQRTKATAAADIESMTHRAREELRGQVASLAVSGAEKILKREIDANAHKALLDQLVAEMG
jgi:F-type H+-transporting ATPase subunit b